MNRLRCVVAMLAVIVFPVLAMAAEAAETVAKPVWYGNVQLWEIVATGVVFLWGILKAKYALDEKLTRQVTEFLEQGVQHTYDTFVREAKAANPKGKLTPAQIGEARTKAFEAAKKFAKEKGIDLAKQVAAEKLPVLLTGIVNRFKKK